MARQADWMGGLHPAPTAPPLPVEDGPQPDPIAPGRTPLRKRIGSALAVLVALAAKFWAKVKLVVLLLPKIKVFSTSASALVSIAAYSIVFGWPFAVGFVVLLFVHEMGHVIQLRREGIKASAPMFIPFLGAVISAKSMGDNALTEAKVGLAGPILGTAGAALVALLGAVLHSDLLLALGYIGFFLNLFNLIPVTPLDGGRAMAAMTPWMWIVGLVMLIGVAIVLPNPVIFIILVLGFFDVRRRLKERKAGGAEQSAYYKVSPRNRLIIGSVYLGLMLALVIGMHAVYVQRTLG
ncbi:MAG: site-2 protease family protein [Solirubrobacteraceae bacterium]